MKAQMPSDFERIKLLLLSFEIREEDITMESHLSIDFRMNEVTKKRFIRLVEWYFDISIYESVSSIKNLGQLLETIHHGRCIESQS